MTTPERDPGYPYGEFDAHEWAIEFDRIYPDHRPDSDTMLAWFANAIMTGYDRGKNESAAADQATIATLRAALDGLRPLAKSGASRAHLMESGVMVRHNGTLWECEAERCIAARELAWTPEERAAKIAALATANETP